MGDGTPTDDCYHTVDEYFDPKGQELQKIWVKEYIEDKKYDGNKNDGKGYHNGERDAHEDVKTIEEYHKGSSKGPAKGQILKGVVDHRAGISLG